MPLNNTSFIGPLPRREYLLDKLVSCIGQDPEENGVPVHVGFNPTHELVLFTGKIPTISPNNPDNSFLRRLKVINFPHKYEEIPSAETITQLSGA